MAVDQHPDRVARIWDMTPEARREAAAQGHFSLDELRHWSARAPHEVDLIGGEFFWIAALDPNYCE